VIARNRLEIKVDQEVVHGLRIIHGLHHRFGKAFEDAKDYERSFKHYDDGNDLYREHHGFDADLNAKRAQNLKRKFSCEFFSERQGFGSHEPDPIFIVGMPRSGSTLLEQILSCHSQVEGTT
jgi:hypothetical protein